MRIIDLTHPISPEMPVYPGTEPPAFTTPCTIERDGFAERRITMYSHTGTHIDAPAHIFPHGKRLDEFPAGHFCGRAVVLDFAESGQAVIEREDLQAFETVIAECDFVILHTGWSRFWGEEAYFQGFPVLTVTAAEWLSGFSLKGLGTDTISVDAVGTTNFPVHKVFLKRDTIIIENLTNLSGLAGAPFDFCALPLRLEGADGSPVRAIALINDRTQC